VLFGSADKVMGIWRNRPKIWPDKWILHHDNAPLHDVLIVREFLAKKSITKLDYTPYLPDLAPCDFWLFPKFKKKKPLMG
jgi:hypothetical protein